MDTDKRLSLNLSNPLRSKPSTIQRSTTIATEFQSQSVRIPQKDRGFTILTNEHFNPASDRLTAELERAQTRTGRRSVRLETINTFSSKTRFFDSDCVSKPKKPFILQNIINSKDSISDIKAIVSKSKNDCFRRRKASLKGTMHVNDLWGKVYQKRIDMEAQMDNEFTNSYDLMAKLVEEQHAQYEMLKASSTREKIMTRIKSEIPQTSIRDLQNIRKINSDGGPADTSGMIQREGDVNSQMPKILEEEKDKSYSDVEQFKVNDDRSSRRLPKTVRQTKSKFFLPQTLQTVKPIRTRLRTERSSNMEMSCSKDFSNFSLKNCDTFTNDSKSPKTLSEFNFSVRKVSSFQKLKSRSIKRNSPFGKLEETQVRESSLASETRTFLNGTSNQVDELIENCKTELRDGDDIVKLMHNIKGLFATVKFDKNKKKELQQKNKFINECRNVLRRDFTVKN